MSWLLLTIAIVALIAITLWLKAKLNKYVGELNKREAQLNQMENYLRQEQARHNANLDERLKLAQAQDATLAKRKAELEAFAKWLKSEDLRMQKKYDDMEAKIKAAFEERDSARQRAKRLQEEVKALKAKSKPDAKSGDLITP